MKYMPLILLGVLLNAGAQIALKAGMRRIGYFEFIWSNALQVSWQVATNYFVIFGLGLYFISVAIWLLVLSRVEVSYAYPMLSVGYIVNTLAAWALFDEKLSITRVCGVLVIIIGVFLVSRS
ncbi:MAG: hypothetical protein DHS20C01_34280 [marine bacterium B5-7]|nr:MAG: hypothetical protein DHS20C01_34280 [marine bacterium B5-7]